MSTARRKGTHVTNSGQPAGRQPKKSWRDLWDTIAQDHRMDRTAFGQYLVRQLALDRGLVGQWMAGKALPTDGNLLALLEGVDDHDRPILTDQEANALIRYRLESDRLTGDLYPYIIRALRQVSRAASATPPMPALLRRSRPTRVLVLAPSPLDNPTYLTELYTGIMNKAASLGLDAPFMPIRSLKGKRPLRTYTLLEDVVGVIAVTCDVQNSKWIAECAAGSLPLVLIHDTIPLDRLPAQGKITLFLEETGGLRLLVRHLIMTHQCRHLHVVTTPYRTPSPHPHRHRKVQAILDAAAEFGVPLREEACVHEIPTYTYRAATNLARDLLETEPDIDGIICLQDVVAAGIADVVRHIGRKVYVTGYDNSRWAQEFGLTCVGQSLEEIGEAAVLEVRRLADMQQTGDEKPMMILTHTVPTLRRSCCPE